MNIFISLMFLLVPALASAQDKEPWELTVMDQGAYSTSACFVNRQPGCSGKVSMVFPLYMLQHNQNKQRFLIDAGLSRWTQKMLSSKVPPLEASALPIMQESWTDKDLLAKGLTEANIHAVLMTHAHWDHTAGLMDLPGTAVWLSPDEAEWIRSRKIPYQNGVVPELMIGHPARTYRWQKSAVSKWFSKSVNLVRDGSLVAVSLSGHTPGNTGYLVQSDKGPILFVGDLFYAMAETLRDSRRPYFLSRFVDYSRTDIERTITELENFVKDRPDVLLVPNHDPEQNKKLYP